MPHQVETPPNINMNITNTRHFTPIYYRINIVLVLEDKEKFLRARSDEQSFLPNSLPKLHAIQSTVTIFYVIITFLNIDRQLKHYTMTFILKNCTN